MRTKFQGKGGDFGYAAIGAVRDHDDVGSRGERGQHGDAVRQMLRHGLVLEVCRARFARGCGRLRQCILERRPNRRDAFAIMRDDSGEPARQIHVAQKPDQPVEQQVLHSLVELELQCAGNFVCARWTV